MDTDSDMDLFIKNYRGRIKRELGIENDKELVNIFSKEFVNPTKDNPMKVAEFLSFLNIKDIEPLLRKIYPRFKRIRKNAFAKTKFLLYMILKNMRSISGAYRTLKKYPEDVKLLGFSKRKLQSYETIREFINNRLTDELLDELFDAFLISLKNALGKLGKTLGKRRGEDATIIRAKRNDPEAEYNDYYREDGYKKDIVLDLDLKIPIGYTNMGINDFDGDCFVPSLQKAEELGLHHCEEIKVDGKYPTYENIAIAKIDYKVDMVYLPQEHWVINEKGNKEAIINEYQKHWKHTNFRPNANIKFMLQFLCKCKKFEHVGAYYRNKVMKEYKKDPDEYKMERKYSERNKDEWFNYYIKEHLGFDLNLPRKGKRAAFRHTTLCLIAILAVALNRVQNNIIENLSSTVYLV